MCELLVGLPDVNVLAVDDDQGRPLVVSIETRGERPSCVVCSTPATVKDRACGDPGRPSVFRATDGSSVAEVPMSKDETLPSPAVGSPQVARIVDAIKWEALDLSGPYRLVFDTMLPDAVQVTDPFHLVKVRHEARCVRGWVRGPPCWSVAADR